MNRPHLRYIVPLTVFAVLGLAIAAKAQFSGPTTQPTGGNVPGVIWNTAGTAESQPNAQINFAEPVTGNNFPPGSINYVSDVGFKTGRALRADGVGATTLNMGNWGAGQQPFNLGIYGDLKVNRFAPFGAGRRGRVDAEEYCIAGANCISAWPSGGGGTLTGITAGTGVTVTGGAPSPTINVTDNYVNTTGDTMTGNLTMTNAYPNTYNPAGYGGYFWGLNGIGVRGSGVNSRAINSSIGSDVTNGYAGYFDANLALGTSYGIYARGSSNGAAAIFLDSGINRQVVLASNAYGLLVSGNTILGYSPAGDTTTVSGTLMLRAPSTQLCLGLSGGLPDCRTSWPASSAPGGANGNIQFNNSGTLGGDGNLTWDNVNKRMLVGTGPVDTSSNVTFYGGGGVKTTALTATGTNWGIKTQGNARGLVAISPNGAGIETTGQSGLIAVANGVSSVPSYLDAAGKFRHMSGNKYTYIGSRTADEIYTQGNVRLDGYTDPLTYGNLILPATGRIDFDGTLDHSGSMQLFNNDFYWNMGTGNDIYFRNSGAALTPFTFRSNGEFHSYGTTAGMYFTARSNPTIREWALFADNGFAYLGNNLGWTNRVVVSDAGYLGLGMSPTYQLQLSLNSAAKPGSTTWVIASDSRLKDVKGDYTKGLNEIIKLNPITYNYKKENPYSYKSDETYVGAIAQEVQKVFPEAVKEDSMGYLQLDTNSVNWATINAIKELKAENDALKAQNETLEQRLKVIEYTLRNQK